MAKKETKVAGAGTAIAVGLGIIGAAAVGALACAAMGGEDPRTAKRLKKVEKRSRVLRRRIDRVEREAGTIEIITPPGCYDGTIGDQEPVEA